MCALIFFLKKKWNSKEFDLMERTFDLNRFYGSEFSLVSVCL